MATFSPAAVELVKSFEGLELTAYPDPGSGGEPWTIGYGHTEGVEPWHTCTEEQALEWLVEDLKWAEMAIVDYVRVELPQSVHDALVSFVFNIGASAFGDSTLVRRLNAGEDIGPVIEQELPRWVKASGVTMLGLVRRRDAEVELAISGLDKQEPQQLATIDLVQAVEHFKGLDHQVEAFDYLEGLLAVEELSEFARLYRNQNETGDVLLNVRYYYQLDNGPEGFRQCFSSTNSMLLEYEEPGTLSSANGDLEYLERLEQFGDTTDSAAQVKTLQSFGVDCEFVMDGTWEDIEDQLSKGHPVPVGWLHRGPVSAPTGGGHWSLIVGIKGDTLVVHDPFGEASLVSGGYVDNGMTAGQFVEYSKKNFGPRWMVEGPGTGWMIRVG